MVKRVKSVRKPATARKAPRVLKRAPGNIDLKKEIESLRRELAEALERQNATSEVLQVISSTPGELQPVFQKMLENATRVCGAKFGTMILLEGDIVRQVAAHNVPAAFANATELRNFRPHPKSGLGQVLRTKQVAHVVDIRKNQAYLEANPIVVALSDLAGARTIVVICFESVIRSKAGIRQAFFGIGAGRTQATRAKPVDHAVVTIARIRGNKYACAAAGSSLSKPNFPLAFGLER